MVYGLAPSKQDRLQSLLSSYGTLTQFHAGPLDSNYVVVAFDDPSVGPRLQRQSGELRLDGCYLGVKRVDAGAWQGQGTGSAPVSRQSGQQALRRSAQTQPDAIVRSDADDPFASISTLTPIKSGGSVFRPAAATSSVQNQAVVPSQYAFGTGASEQQSQQQQQQSQGQQQQMGQMRGGFFGRISDVMVSGSRLRPEPCGVG